MRITFTSIISILTLSLFGQDTTYYNMSGDKANSIELAHNYKIIFRDDTDTNNVLSRDYFISGQIKSEGYYNPYSEKKKYGPWEEWYETGQIRAEKNYENGIMSGQLLTFWENGQHKRRDFYENGILKYGEVWNSDGKNVKYYDYIIQPEFPGGMEKLYKYLGRNVKYPVICKEGGIQGRVVVRFVIEKDGKISNVRVTESVHHILDAEAIRVVKKMPKWSPGLQDGEKIRAIFNLPIKFSLN